MSRTASFSACALTIAAMLGIVSVAHAQPPVPPPPTLPSTGTCKLTGARTGVETYTYALTLANKTTCFWESKMVLSVAGPNNKPMCGRVTLSSSGFEYTAAKPGCTERLTFVLTLSLPNPPPNLVTMNVSVSVK